MSIDEILKAKLENKLKVFRKEQLLDYLKITGFFALPTLLLYTGNYCISHSIENKELVWPSLWVFNGLVGPTLVPYILSGRDLFRDLRYRTYSISKIKTNLKVIGD